MTPAELLLLEKDLAAEQAQEVELENQRQAMLLAAIYNAPHFVPSKRLSPADFLPKKQASDEELAAKLYNLHAYHS